MRWWPISRRYDNPRGASAERHLAEAYRNLFRSDSDDAQIVLADLAHFTGFYRVNGPEIPADARAHSDGMRAAFGRLFRFLNLTEEERGALVEASRVETLTSSNQGDI